MRQNEWNTYRITGYTHDVANDQRSAGGVHLHQVKRCKSTWLKRVTQSNGDHRASGEAWPVSAPDGEAAFETAVACG